MALYASPDVQPADLVWLIERELAAQGVASPRLVPAEVVSTVPVHLKGVLTSAHAGQGLALVAPSISPERVGAYRGRRYDLDRRGPPPHYQQWHRIDAGRSRRAAEAR